MAQTRSRKIAVATRTRSGNIAVATSHRATSTTQASTTTRTKSRKIAKPKPKNSQRDITAKSAKAVQKSIDGPNLATERAERSNSAKTAGIGDVASTCDTGNTTKNHAANNQASSTIEDPAPSDPAPTTSTTGAAASTCETNAPPMASTQPANTTTNISASPPSITTAATTTATTADATPSTHDAIEQMSTIANDHPEVNTTTSNSAPPPSTITAATTTAATTTAAMTNNSAPPPSTTTSATTTATTTATTADAIEQMSTIANDSPEVNTRDKAQSLARVKKVPQSVSKSVLVRPRRSTRPSRKIGAKPFIEKRNRPDNPIIIDDTSDDDGSDEDGSDDDGSDDVPISSSMKQVLQYRQDHVENMKSTLDSLIAYIGSTPDSDQSADYDNVRVGQKRSFAEFITSELDDSDQPRVFANDLIYEIGKYQGMLRRTQAFQRQR